MTAFLCCRMMLRHWNGCLLSICLRTLMKHWLCWLEVLGRCDNGTEQSNKFVICKLFSAEADARLRLCFHHGERSRRPVVDSERAGSPQGKRTDFGLTVCTVRYRLAYLSRRGDKCLCRRSGFSLLTRSCAYKDSKITRCWYWLLYKKFTDLSNTVSKLLYGHPVSVTRHFIGFNMRCLIWWHSFLQYCGLDVT